MSDKELQKEILALENDVKQLEATIDVIKQRITHLKDIAWDRQSKKESSQMYKVLKEDKTHTRVKSNVGDIKVDKDFMDKEIKKHLDNPNLRGMVTTQEMLSFPKVAKGVEANNEARGYTWQVKANDQFFTLTLYNISFSFLISFNLCVNKRYYTMDKHILCLYNLFITTKTL